MKNIISFLILTIFLGMSLNCNQPVIGGLSSKNITGKEAIKKLVDAASQIDTIYIRSVAGSSTSSSTISSATLLASLLNGLLVPIAAGIEEDKYYLKDGVEKCVTNIYALGLILENFVTVGLSCDIRPAPVLGLP
ncbi:MAG: TIGR04452 family lipoprotein [Leptospira bouyouniensis]|uniref:TIGR04452 family lipoprotein n=1 Tax=Leptospira bouyouniensis TaxID=2484911 RepID=A0A7I0HNQ7_9LEPT|nr:TIGR04452 family lipoprotein [Leptospira bouyouniensis]TGK47111.1 TIGR04452 family lipoprotein [Leptospira bouyouniensis]TGL03290.1 TIGR04452 family lipoprotein [Leptospira bouyouniensis]TGM80217.1 TIGR04452 family lipoprotein [Leptospira bouyouniensis]